MVKKGLDRRTGKQRRTESSADLIEKNKAKWNEQSLHDLFDPEIVVEITTVSLSSQDIKDRLVGTNTEYGEFTVKSAYLQQNQRGNCYTYSNTSLIVLSYSHIPMARDLIVPYND